MKDKHDIWEHQTAKHDDWYEKNEAGLDLFDETDYYGEVLTAIYIRYEDGTRMPARTVSHNTPNNPGHAQSVLDAWSERFLNNDAPKTNGHIIDYRSNPTVVPAGPSTYERRSLESCPTST